MNKKLILVFFLIILVLALWNNPFDREGVLQATIISTLPLEENQTIIISTKNIGSYSNMSIGTVSVFFLEKTEIQKMANNQGPIQYHEFNEFMFILIGYRVSVDHMIMYPSNASQICYSCYGETGIVRYKQGKWVFHLTAGWVS
jgi:hypothetical protein